MAFVKTADQLSLRKKCELLSVNRSVLYYESQSDADDIWLINLIRDIWLKYTFYGYRKITIILQRDYKLSINRKRVLRLMQVVGIQAIYPKPNLSKNNSKHKTYKYLLNDISIIKINQVWQVDITYLKINTRFVYLVALIDVYSRYIVAWSVSFALDTENCLDALSKALKTATPEIVNSDQGCQFTSDNWINALLEKKILISMDGKGRCKDNIYIERFWRSIKYEAIHLHDCDYFIELYNGINEYINFYNEQRPHQSLEYLCPADIYKKNIVLHSRQAIMEEEIRKPNALVVVNTETLQADAYA